MAAAGYTAVLGATNTKSTAKTSKANYNVTLRTAEAKDTISRMIYGQFAEHLGSCVYEGIWVGKDSNIPNTNGYRNDALEALRELRVPVLRWPGGCFADDYHWRDGVGDPAKRPTLINNNWGGTQEDNSFGTHEFFNLCEMLGIEPYLSVNIGSGTVQEAAQWIEYITAPNGPMAAERAANGRTEPWKLKYTGIGNESWGCGGEMRPEYYSDVYRRYSVYMRNQPDNKLFRIASGASDYDYNWTKTLMSRIGNNRMNGLSLHYYTVANWDKKGSATDFDTDVYYTTIGKSLEIEPVIERHIDIMNEKDPDNRVGLMVDEWGTWFDEEPGTTPGHLFQQNTMRDAMVAALTLNVFHRHAQRVKMANIAQLANVLQAMWLTKGEQMVLTPTYYVFKMYRPHQDAVAIPLNVDCDTITDANGRNIPTLAATASRAADGSVTITFTNPIVNQTAHVEIDLPKEVGTKIASAELLTAPDIHTRNTFENPDAVKTTTFTGAKVKGGKLLVDLPAVSVASLTLKK
jgi:alpha-N-arabinofuranosidase